MGTAVASFNTGIGSREERDALAELLKLVEKRGNEKKRAALDQLFREVINEALKSADRNTKENIARAIQGPVMNKITSKYITWKERDGKDPKKWPFDKQPKKKRNLNR
jgi:hypothetical protein